MFTFSLLRATHRAIAAQSRLIGRRAHSPLNPVSVSSARESLVSQDLSLSRAFYLFARADADSAEIEQSFSADSRSNSIPPIERVSQWPNGTALTSTRISLLTVLFSRTGSDDCTAFNASERTALTYGSVIYVVYELSPRGIGICFLIVRIDFPSLIIKANGMRVADHDVVM